MTLGKLFLDLWLGLLVLSLAAVVIFALAWMVIPVVTVVSAQRQAKRRHVPDGIDRLVSAYSEEEIAEIDQALEAILAQEWPGELTRRG